MFAQIIGNADAMCVHRQREFSDVGLTMTTTRVKTPLWRQLFSVLMDRCCVAEGNFFPRKVVMCGCGDGANSSWLFILSTVSCRCFTEGS